MAQLAAAETAPRGDLPRSPEKPIKILAKSLFRQLRENGYDDRQIVALSTELIGLLTVDLRDPEHR